MSAARPDDLWEPLTREGRELARTYMDALDPEDEPEPAVPWVTKIYPATWILHALLILLLGFTGPDSLFVIAMLTLLARLVFVLTLREPS